MSSGRPGLPLPAPTRRLGLAAAAFSLPFLGPEAPGGKLRQMEAFLFTSRPSGIGVLQCLAVEVWKAVMWYNLPGVGCSRLGGKSGPCSPRPEAAVFNCLILDVNVCNELKDHSQNVSW